VQANQRRAAAGPGPGHRATGAERGAQPPGRFDYTTVGHVTVDVLPDGTRQAGGSAFYSALQAGRLGLRAHLLTRGVEHEIERLLEPYRGELELSIQPALETTTLGTHGSGSERRQQLLAWAGAMEGETRLETAILHLAPVAQELPGRWRGQADFIGLTPQGLARQWPPGGGEVSPAPAPARRGEGCDAVVISEVERSSCEELVARALQSGAVVAVTAGHRPTTILMPGGETLAAPATPSGEAREDLGAGDVFAAAFFVALHEGRGVKDAAAFAGAAAALRLACPGTDGIAGRSTIEAHIGAHAGPRG
jgi:hypothetical protein